RGGIPPAQPGIQARAEAFPATNERIAVTGNPPGRRKAIALLYFAGDDASERPDRGQEVRGNHRVRSSETRDRAGQAAVADQVGEQLDLAFGRRLTAEGRQLAWHRDVVADRKLVQRLPALQGEERMRRRGPDPAPEAGRHLEYRLDPVVHPIRRTGAAQAQVVVERAQRAGPPAADFLDGGDRTVVLDDLGIRAEAFAHGRARRQDQQVGRLQAGGHLVELGVAGRQAGDAAAALEALLQDVEGL